MNIAVFVVGCVLAGISGLGLAACLERSWFQQTQLAGAEPGYALPTLGLLVLTVLLATIANLLIGIGASSVGAQRERRS